MGYFLTTYLFVLFTIVQKPEKRLRSFLRCFCQTLFLMNFSLNNYQSEREDLTFEVFSCIQRQNKDIEVKDLVTFFISKSH